MGELVDGDDGLPAEVVGAWAKEKVDLLCQYVHISSAPRKRYLPPDNTGGAAFIDLFCGPGRSFIKETKEWIDAGPVAAWNRSVACNAPFTRVIIADADQDRLTACETRLIKLNAPVVAKCGLAKETAFWARQKAPQYGLNFAFLDPYSLEALDFKIIKTLALIKRIDVLVHISTMDLQRNLDLHLTSTDSAFDAFAPGWREALQVRSRARTREDLLTYWRELVSKRGISASEDVRLIKGSRGQRLYWLLLAARHQLALKFWKTISPKDGQRLLDL
ncbi:three-Cys-motif partner protein [Phyllobacterium sp. CL33Tsu]|uniref:three-Cys-motif partner protein TcmP n=1 Tax=Phyllobacterium sp. CL33Tsu TaxID=1798191 RepID=UPI0008EB22AF|nr:three-Cys-motif partner protein TcmP [Phyllobacterium sp. CL33Tsu]SFJ54511.1 three-Cys-motif partner protein [Phyllobacterium sp. CL33Tsu]